MSTAVKLAALLFLVSVFLNLALHARNENESVYFTWMSNTNWLVETAEVRILLDGWFTRIPFPGRPDLEDLKTLYCPPAENDTAAVKRVHELVNKNKKLDYIFSGHSHFDHSFDTAVWARLTGAKIIGPRSTCLQARAMGIPQGQCQSVEGGEKLQLSPHLSVRVIRWHHSGDTTTAFGKFLQTPMELVEIPLPDSLTSCFKPGPLDDFPNGGGARAYLFIYNKNSHTISWLYSNTGNAMTFEKTAAIDKAFLSGYNMVLKNMVITPQEKPVREYLKAAVQSEKLNSIDLWIGMGYREYVRQVTALIRPKAFIPQHWDGAWNDFFKGLNKKYANVSLLEYLEKERIYCWPQQQFMDKYQLDKHGLKPVRNNKIKEKLGLQTL